MIDDWTHGYIHIPIAALRAFEATLSPTGNVSVDLPFDGKTFRAKGLLYPMMTNGFRVDEFGIQTQVYKPVPNNDTVLALIAIRPGAEAVIGQLEASQDVSVYMDATDDEMQAIYPEHCMGRGVPHLSRKNKNKQKST